MTGCFRPPLLLAVVALLIAAAGLPAAAQEPGTEARREAEARALIAEVTALRARGKDSQAWELLRGRRVDLAPGRGCG